LPAWIIAGARAQSSCREIPGASTSAAPVLPSRQTSGTQTRAASGARRPPRRQGRRLPSEHQLRRRASGRRSVSSRRRLWPPRRRRTVHGNALDTTRLANLNGTLTLTFDPTKIPREFRAGGQIHANRSARSVRFVQQGDAASQRRNHITRARRMTTANQGRGARAALLDAIAHGQVSITLERGRHRSGWRPEGAPVPDGHRQRSAIAVGTQQHKATASQDIGRRGLHLLEMWWSLSAIMPEFWAIRGLCRLAMGHGLPRKRELECVRKP